MTNIKISSIFDLHVFENASIKMTIMKKIKYMIT